MGKNVEKMKIFENFKKWWKQATLRIIKSPHMQQ